MVLCLLEEYHFKMSIDLILGVASFSGIILLLVLIIVFARSKLVSTGNVSIEINGDASNPIVVPSGSKLLQTLADNNIFLASACGGGGTCSQCKCQVLEGGGSILAAEESHFNSTEQKQGWSRPAPSARANLDGGEEAAVQPCRIRVKILSDSR